MPLVFSSSISLKRQLFFKRFARAECGHEFDKRRGCRFRRRCACLLLHFACSTVPDLACRVAGITVRCVSITGLRTHVAALRSSLCDTCRGCASKSTAGSSFDQIFCARQHGFGAAKSSWSYNPLPQFLCVYAGLVASYATSMPRSYENNVPPRLL